MKTGERLLTATVDSIADADPTRTCFVIPDESSEIDYIDISYKRFANSINRLAWHLKQTIGVSDQFETVCYLGPPDLLYFVFALAACKCGFKVSRNSLLLDYPLSPWLLTSNVRLCSPRRVTASKHTSIFCRLRRVTHCSAPRVPRYLQFYHSTRSITKPWGR